MYLTDKEKIYGLSKIWREAEYNFPFWDTIKDIDWDKEYLDSLDVVIESDDIIDYYLELMKFISKLGDGHTSVQFPMDVYKKMEYFPIKIVYINGKHVIKGIGDKYNIPLLSQITMINNIPIDEYLQERIFPYCWHTNIKSCLTYVHTIWPVQKDGLLANAYTLINYINKEDSIEITTTNEKFTLFRESDIQWNEVDIKNHSSSDTFDVLYSSDFLDIRLSNDNIGVITIPTFMNDKLPEVFYSYINELEICKGFVIDIRNNSGGNSTNADAIAQAFIKGDFETGRVKHLVHIGAYLAWGKSMNLDGIDLDNPFYKKVKDVTTKSLYEETVVKSQNYNCTMTLEQPVIVLTNSSTISSAENFIINLDNIGRVSIVGTTTYGSTGNPLTGSLPGGGNYSICTRRYSYPNGKEFINIGVTPHIEIENDIEDYRKGYDKVFEKGIEYLRSQISL